MNVFAKAGFKMVKVTLTPLHMVAFFLVLGIVAYAITKYDVGKQHAFQIIFGTWIAGAILFAFFFFFMGVVDGEYWESDNDNVYFLSMAMIVLVAFLLLLWARYITLRGVQSDYFFAFIIIAIVCGFMAFWMIGWALNNTFGSNFLKGEHTEVDLGWLPDIGNWKKRGSRVSAESLAGVIGIFLGVVALAFTTYYLTMQRHRRRRK